MAYRRGIRDAYEARFAALDSREVTVHRVVNIVEKRPRPAVEYDRGYDDDPWYGVPRHYHDAREYHAESSYSHDDRRYYEDNSHDHYRRSSPQHEGPYSHSSYARDDLRHQLGSRSSSRGGPYYRSRGRGSGAPRRSSPSISAKRDRSPVRRESQPPVPVRSGSNTSTRSFSPDREKSASYQQAQQRHKPSVQTSHTPSSSVEETPHASGSSKEKTQTASVAETEEVEVEVEVEQEREVEAVEEVGEVGEVEEVEEVEEMVSASMEPKPTPEEDFKARRLEAIKAKSLEVEKHYRADCETFRTVVKMLVDKEPSLDNLLQAPLDENLSEIKERCLESLRHFVKELDEVLKQPDTSA
ncbi:periphilin-1-like isoform X2 [Sebastes umbrosus]|nr:periphilin-1-like isoform X2 [Sebastes umbrosus]XP_037624353.1 periphilin-1-like isoform X2 [Sebastes umbrosus]